ncbi:MAG TPA: regulatory protein RecX [Thermoanaerobaculia bacterium]|nr:regulatory protein RecX [Thermoanaerobaculia bacterium]
MKISTAAAPVGAAASSEVMAAAGRLLTRRGYFEHELRTRLLGAGHDAAAVDAALERLKTLELLDDARLACFWIEERTRTKPRSREALRQELEGKGVDTEVVEQALASCAPDDLAQARALASAAVGRMSGLPLEVQVRRLRGRLLTRGFETEIVTEAVRAVLPPEGWD